jgi:3-isopropylmalate dehydrogenase
MAKSYKIAVIGGDGTGPEVVAEARKVLDATGVEIKYKEFDFGGERYKRTGETLPDGALDELRKYDAILLGAIGDPNVKPGILEKGLLLATRFGLDQFINLRPVRLYPGVKGPVEGKGPEDIDFVIVRENTEGLYAGMGGVQFKGTPHEVATQVMCDTRMGVDRCLRYAFDYAKNKRPDRPWKGLSEEDKAKGYVGELRLVHKTNVLTNVGDLWFRAFNEMGENEFPDIKREYAHVDATCMWMVKNPEWFDVAVTGNMFGDIITDLGAMIQGGMGIAAGGNINPDGVSMFEPIGGSAPKYTGKNVINPLASIESARMMLEHLGEADAAKKIQKAVMHACMQMDSFSAGKMGFSTTEIGDLVAGHVVSNN